MTINTSDFESTAVARPGDSPIKWRPPTRVGLGSAQSPKPNVLRPGVVIANGDTNLVVINVNGNGRVKIVINATWASGTFTVTPKIRYADHLTPIPASWIPQTTTSPVGTGVAQEILVEVPQIAGACYVELSVANSAGVAVTINQVDVFIGDEQLPGQWWRDSQGSAGTSAAAPVANTNISGSVTVVEGGIYDVEANVGFGAVADTPTNFALYKLPVGGAAAATSIKFAAPGAVNSVSPAEKCRMCLQPGDQIFIGNPVAGVVSSIYIARLAVTKVS